MLAVNVLNGLTNNDYLTYFPFLYKL